MPSKLIEDGLKAIKPEVNQGITYKGTGKEEI
jgi:hypothetical protein